MLHSHRDGYERLVKAARDVRLGLGHSGWKPGAAWAAAVYAGRVLVGASSIPSVVPNARVAEPRPADFASQLEQTQGFMDEIKQSGIDTAAQAGEVTDQYREDTRRNLDKATAAGEEVTEFYEGRSATATGAAQRIAGGAQALERTAGGQSADLLKYSQDRYANIAGYLETLGMQQRADVNRQYDEFQTQMDQNLIDRGLTGSTIAPSVKSGVERARWDAMGNLNDRLNRERLDYHSGLSGDVMNTMSGNRQFGYAAGQNTLGFQQDALNTFLGTSGDVANSMGTQQQRNFDYGSQTFGNQFNAGMGELGFNTGQFWQGIDAQYGMMSNIYDTVGDYQQQDRDFQMHGQNQLPPATPGQLYQQPQPSY